ncbi:hypothetical protein GW17_00012949 [Ensete ventricosum]|nr:hypothetical protein GW17_00012949 [Ensete ventricosum]RZR76739.1 hypothetical protein BHM03_00001619 [Ensete ventricosum]
MVGSGPCALACPHQSWLGEMVLGWTERPPGLDRVGELVYAPQVGHLFLQEGLVGWGSRPEAGRPYLRQVGRTGAESAMSVSSRLYCVRLAMLEA